MIKQHHRTTHWCYSGYENNRPTQVQRRISGRDRGQEGPQISSRSFQFEKNGETGNNKSEGNRSATQNARKSAQQLMINLANSAKNCCLSSTRPRGKVLLRIWMTSSFPLNRDESKRRCRLHGVFMVGKEGLMKGVGSARVYIMALCAQCSMIIVQ